MQWRPAQQQGAEDEEGREQRAGLVQRRAIDAAGQPAHRLLVVLAAVGLVSVATAVAGPIAFVAFLAGPIAARAMGTRGSLLAPAALVGALLTLCADYAGQFLLPGRYPVGVVTGALGAPYLLYLIVRAGRSGALS